MDRPKIIFSILKTKYNKFKNPSPDDVSGIAKDLVYYANREELSKREIERMTIMVGKELDEEKREEVGKKVSNGNIYEPSNEAYIAVILFALTDGVFTDDEYDSIKDRVTGTSQDDKYLLKHGLEEIAQEAARWYDPELIKGN